MIQCDKDGNPLPYVLRNSKRLARSRAAVNCNDPASRREHGYRVLEAIKRVQERELAKTPDWQAKGYKLVEERYQEYQTLMREKLERMVAAFGRKDIDVDGDAVYIDVMEIFYPLAAPIDLVSQADYSTGA